MTVKLWGVDRLHLRFDYHSESIHSLFQLFVQNFVYFFIFLLMKLTHIQVFIKKCMKLEYIYFFIYKQTLFFLLMFCMFRYSYNKIYTY